MEKVHQLSAVLFLAFVTSHCDAVIRSGAGYGEGTFVGDSSPLYSFLNFEGRECNVTEFRCDNGQCIPGVLVCNHKSDCKDESDELNCIFRDSDTSVANSFARRKRQSTKRCGVGSWKCRDGQCITVDGKCDGAVDCRDGSDESFATCRNSKCPSYLFRCAYGACVDGTAKCNNVKECADNSDEDNLDCKPRSVDKSCGVNFVCNNGDCIPVYERCDGVANCADGSDETVLQCGAERCPSYLFRCAYGACVDGGSNCNGVIDCVDGSDESYDLCNTAPPTTTERTTTTSSTKRPTTTSKKPNKVTKPPQPVAGGCITPPRSAGNYRVEPNDNFGPGKEVPPYTLLTFECGAGASLPGKVNITFCSGNNVWSTEPKCRRQCRPLSSRTVTYTCEEAEGKRGKCDKPVEQGTVAIPKCKPSYTSPTVLAALTCLPGGNWDNSVTCAPDCGTITPKGQTLIVNGRDVEHGEFPWHVGVFQKSADEPSGWLNICGGSIVNEAIVVSAAHCFYVDGVGVNDASQYAVASGKLYRDWDSSLDDPKFVQKSNVKQLVVPEFYGGITRHYQADLALMILETYLTFSSLVRPVCISFDGRLENLQLVKGNAGKVAGWGLLAEDGKPSEVLKTAELPFVEYNDCVASLPVSFQPFLTTDKICAGWTNGTAVCKGDSGGGLVFAITDASGILRHYLRGIVSNSPLNDAKTSCRSDNYAAFTKISMYNDFISETWSRHQPR